jgi:drug/metabolite transporter (DMT)-like permease
MSNERTQDVVETGRIKIGISLLLGGAIAFVYLIGGHYLGKPLFFIITVGLLLVMALPSILRGGMRNRLFWPLTVLIVLFHTFCGYLVVYHEQELSIWDIVTMALVECLVLGMVVASFRENPPDVN